MPEARSTSADNKSKDIFFAVFSIVIFPVGIIFGSVLIVRALLSKDHKNLLKGAALLVLSLIVAAAVIYGSSLSSKKTPVYNQSDFNTYLLKGKSKGGGIEFSKPKNVQQYGSVTSNSYGRTALLIKKITNKTTTPRILVSTVDQKNSDDYIKNLNGSLVSSNAAISGVYTKPLESFFSNGLSPNSEIKYQKFVPFTSNSNIKNNIWTSDFTAITKDKTQSFQGKAVYAITKDNAYYFEAYDTDKNWVANKDTWNIVFNSIKIEK